MKVLLISVWTFAVAVTIVNAGELNLVTTPSFVTAQSGHRYVTIPRGKNVTFSVTPSSTLQSLDWTFQYGQPHTASGNGPHVVIYDNSSIENNTGEVKFASDRQDEGGNTCTTTDKITIYVNVPRVTFTAVRGTNHPWDAHDEYGQPKNNEFGHQQWGAATFSPDSSIKVSGSSKRWNYSDVTAGGGGSCNSAATCTPSGGYQSCGATEIKIAWPSIEGKNLKVKLKLKSTCTPVGACTINDTEQSLKSLYSHSGSGDDDHDVEVTLTKSPYRLAVQPSVAITSGTVTREVTYTVEILSFDLIDKS